MSQSKSIPISNNQYSTPISNTRNNNLMATSPRSVSDQPRLFIFTNPNIFSPPIASLKTELKKKNIPFEVISNSNNLKQLISDNKGNCLAVIESQRQSATDISCIFPQNYIYPKSTSNVQIISYPNPIPNTSFQAKNNPTDVLASFKKFVQVNQTNKIRLKKVHTSKDIKFQQAPINTIRQASSPLKNNKQFFEKLYYYDPPNQNDQQYKLLVQSLKNIENVFPFNKLQDVTQAAKQLKKQNKILALVSHNQAAVLKRHIQYTKKQKQIQFMIFGIDQPRKQLMSPNMYFASNDALQIIDQLSKIGFSRMFDCRRKYQELSTHKKLVNGGNPQHQFASSFTPSKFQRLQLNRISQRSGASIFSNASSQQQRFVRNWTVDKDPNNDNQYHMIEENKEQYDVPIAQLNTNSRRTSMSNRSRKSQSIDSNRLGEEQNQNGFRKSLEPNQEQQRLKNQNNLTQSQFIISKNQQNLQKSGSVKKIVKLTKTNKDQSIVNISLSNTGKPPYQQMPSNVIQETSEQYRGSNRQSIVNMEDNFYHYQGNQSSNNINSQSGTNLANSNHQNQQSDRGTGSGFNKIKNSTTVLEPIQQKIQKKRLTYQNNYKVPQENRYISSNQYLIGQNQKKQSQNPSPRLTNTVNNYNQNNVYASMSMAPKIINGLTGQLQQTQSISRAPLIINGLTGQLQPTQVLRLNNVSHEQQINARYYSPSHVVRNTKITPQQVRMPQSSTSTTNQISNQNITSNYYNASSSSRQIRRQPQSSTSIKQHVNNVNIINSTSSPYYNNNSTSNRVNYISYNDPNKNSQNIKVSDYNTISNDHSPSSRQNNYSHYYRNNAGIYNIPSSTTSNTLITTPIQKTVNYIEKKTVTNNLNVEDQDPFHQSLNNKSKLKGSYLNRQIDGKLDPYSPYQGSGIKIDKNNSQGRTKVTYLNQNNQIKSYDRNVISPNKYQVYDVKDNRVIANTPAISNFNVYKGSSNNQQNIVIQKPTQVKRIVIGVDGVRRQITNYQSTGQYQNNTRNYQRERTNMATSPVRQVKLQENRNFISPGKVSVTGGYTGLNLDQYEAHVDQNGRTIYKKKSIGILGQDSNINYRNNNHGDSLKKYEPTRRQYTNSPTRRGEEVKQSAFRKVSLQKPTKTAIVSNYNYTPNMKTYQDKSYQTYNENGYKIKKYVHEVNKYQQPQNTYGNNFNSLKQSSQSIRPLVYDAKSPTKIQTYRGENVITYESPRRYAVQRKEYTQPKVQSSNFNRRIDSKQKANNKKKKNLNNNTGINSNQKNNLKKSDDIGQAKEKNNPNIISNGEKKKFQLKKSQIYEPSDASIMRRNNNRFGVNLYKKQKKLDQSFQLNQLKSKIKSKIFTLSDLNKKMMVNRIIDNERQIQEQKKKFSYIDTEINYFHFLIDEEIGHLKQWVQNYIFAKNDTLQVFRGVQDLYQKVKMADNDQYYNQNDIGFILATSEQIVKINKNLLPENYYIIDLVSPAIFNGMQISQLDKKIKLSKLSNLKLAQKIILQSKLNHILLYQKKNIKDAKNTAYQMQVQQILNIFPDQQFIKQYYQGQITGDLMDGLIDDFRFNRLYIICDEKQMQNVIKKLNIIQKQEGFPKEICKIICLPKDNQILKYQNLIEKHPEVAWITNVSKINDYKSLMKYASRQSQEDKEKEQKKDLQQKQKLFYHARHKNLNQVLQKQFPGRFILESFTSLAQVEKKISKNGSNTKLTKGTNANGKNNSQISNYLIIHPILSQEYLNFKLFKKIFMLGKSDKIQRRVIRVSTNAELIELFRE